MTEDRDYIEEITRINNELTNLQRELTKKKTNLEELTKQLEQSNLQLEAFIDNIPDAIIILNPNGNILMANQVFFSLYDLLTGEKLKINHNFNEVRSNHVFISTIKEILTKQTEKNIQIESIRGEQWLDLRSKKVNFPKSRKIFSIIIQIRDITSFITFDNLRSQFISMVSHELKSPLSVIKLAIYNLKNLGNTLSDSKQERIFDMIETNINSMTKLIDDLLLLSQIESDRFQLEKKWFYIKKEIISLIDQMQMLAEEKQIQIEVDVDPSIELHADLNSFLRIFRILLDNAVKYMRNPGKIYVNSVTDYTGKYNPENIKGVLMQIIDEGIGIKSNEIQNIFERFYRSADAYDTEGTGLGLSIAKDLIQLHNGKIYVDSIFGKGTTFSVFFPIIETKI
jgi:signal transduction histidine kinase